MDWQLRSHNQRSIAGSEHVDLSIFVCPWLLRLPAHSFSFDNSTIESHAVGYAVVRFDMAFDWLSLGNESIICVYRTICEEREETACSVSSIFLLLDSRLAHSTILNETKQVLGLSSHRLTIYIM